MQITVVDSANRDGELVTDLAPKGARLPKPDVMGIGRAPAADEAWLCTHEVSMCFIAFSDRLHERGCVWILVDRS